MSKNKEYKIKVKYFNLILLASVVVIVAISLGISGVVINKIKEKDAYKGPTDAAVGNLTTSTEDLSTEETEAPVLTAKDYFELANYKFNEGEYTQALNYSYMLLDMDADATMKEEILLKVADIYVADNNLRAAYYLLEDCGIEGLLDRYCVEKVDLNKSLTKYVDPTDSNYIYMGYYPQTGYTADELPEYVLEADFDEHDFARVYGVEYTRVKVGEEYEYFVSEPVRWWIIGSDANNYKVLSDMLLDCKPYNNTLETVSWDTCSLKEWTNGEFYNKCFNESEKVYITEHKTPAGWNYYFNFTLGKDTMDKVAMITASSLSDGTHIFKSHDSDESKIQRKCLVTDYARAMGAYVDEDGYGKWWTATAANKEGWYTIDVTPNGVILVVSGGAVVNKDDICVRPYMTIKK